MRENVKAHLRVLVRRILRKYGYPPDKQEKATQTVLEQAAHPVRHLGGVMGEGPRSRNVAVPENAGNPIKSMPDSDLSGFRLPAAKSKGQEFGALVSTANSATYKLRTELAKS
jgi:hypothetical protein